MSAIVLAIGTEKIEAAERSTQARAAIENMLAIEQSAWNSGDSEKYAEVYADDSDFINVRGQIFSGKQAVRIQHQRIFAGPFRHSNIAIVLRRFTMLSEHVALVDTDQTVTNYASLPQGIVSTSPEALCTHFKYVAVEQPGGGWKFVSAQNTAVLP